MEAAVLVILIVLIVLNGLFAMTETAIVAARHARLDRMAESGDPQARAALNVAANPTRSLSTIQIGITSIGILSGIVGEAAFARPLATWLTGFGLPSGPTYVLVTALVVMIVTYLSIVFGELVPKRIGQNHPEALLRLTATPLLALGAATSPFVRLLSGSTDVVLRVLGVQRPAAPAVTEEEIHLMLAEGAKAGVIEDEERRMVQNVFRLDDRPIASLMLPRSDIVALDVEDSFESNLARIQASDHARYPLCRGGLDHVIGVVTARRLLLRARDERKPDLSQVMEPPVFVPETVGGIQLLEQFRSSGVQMAFVVDEYGAVQGLVTVHDLMEAIAGEFSAPGPGESWAVERPDGSWLLDGALPIEDLKERLGFGALPAENRGRFQTLGGLVLFLLGHIPQAGEATGWEEWRLEVVDMDGKRIDKVLALRRPDWPGRD
jgi:putative hemolysin